MNKLTDHDIYWCVRRLPKEVFNLVRQYPKSLSIAGGYIRSCISQEKISDIDLFSNSKDLARAYANQLAHFCKSTVWSTDNAFTVKVKDLPVQFIHRWTFDEPQKIVDSFDFTIARAVIFRSYVINDKRWVWDSICDERFYPDLAAKRLVYCNPIREEEAGGSMLRVLKFYQRGYKIPLDSLGAVMSRMVNKITDDGIMAMAANKNITREVAVGKILTGMLREVDPLIDPNHLSHLETETDINKFEDETTEEEGTNAAD